MRTSPFTRNMMQMSYRFSCHPRSNFTISLAILLTSFVALSSTVNAQQADSLTEKLKAEPIEQLVSDAKRFGQPARGALAFHLPSMNCARCHVAGDNQRRLGPDLAEKREVKWKHLVESVLSPSQTIKEGFETAQILMLDGKILSGVLIEDREDRLLIDQIEQAEEPLEILKEDIDDWQKVDASTMPTQLANQLVNRQQFLDLISYLGAIAEGGPLVADELRPNLATLAPLPEYESRVDHAGLIASLDRDAFKRGEETYRLRCASCHGSLQEEGSMPTSMRFAEGKFKHGNDPHTMYQTLTHGYGMMNPQRWMVPQQKYEVIHYIREHFLKPHNRKQWFDVSEDYLASIPKGDTRGPKPVVSRPWTQMDYGPSLSNTIEVSNDGSNIAQKGIVVRLDDGPGGVESGQYWMLYEHDTLRVAAGWQGNFIDYQGIHFNGAHQRHPRVTGDVVFTNPTGPGFARPLQDSTDGNRNEANATLESRFADDRVIGRDKKHYGPLPKSWGRFLGLYRFGKQTILKYQIGNTEIFESPGLTFSDDQAIYTRNLQLAQRDQPLILQVANHTGQPTIQGSGITLLPPSSTDSKEDRSTSIQTGAIHFKGDQYFQRSANGFNFTDQPFSIAARIRTRKDGTLIANTLDQETWVPQGKSLFLRNGRLTFDIGWVGEVTSNRKINDGKFHDVVMTWEDGQVEFFVDGKPAGGGELAAESKLPNGVIRIGKTNDNFPNKSDLKGQLADLRFYQRVLEPAEIEDFKEIETDQLVARWNGISQGKLIDVADPKTKFAAAPVRNGQKSSNLNAKGLTAYVVGSEAKWVSEKGNLRLIIPAGPACKITLAIAQVEDAKSASRVQQAMAKLEPRSLEPFTHGGPPNYPQTVTTELIPGAEKGPFAVDVFQRPKNNPWNCRMRLTGVDFLPDRDTAVVTAWDGSVWTVAGILGRQDVSTDSAESVSGKLRWRRFASGLFQPLGVKVVDGTVFVICRDQLVALHDLNNDGEADWYENFNSDHQVTEHFHEFAAGLQIDAEKNFYYSKSACHAKNAIVPHHGTLLKISADGKKTEILANGFRAANGVCLNPDGTFFVTDQEGHWTPKNRINLVRKGGFYGNMLGYHDDLSESDDAMEKPICWITNAFDRSPSELLWVNSEKWGPLNGSLLNFSYGYGHIYVVPHERDGEIAQGGMSRLPIDAFPTGVMRGRFHPDDGQLYCCGMFAWAGNQQQPGGFYRVRYTDEPVHAPLEFQATKSGIRLTLSDAVELESSTDIENYRVEAWDLVRAPRYGSKHHNQRTLPVTQAVSKDGKTIELTIDGLKPTRGLKIQYSLQGTNGQRVTGEIHGSIHRLPK